MDAITRIALGVGVAIALAACTDSSNRHRVIEDLDAKLQAHERWVNAGGCQPDKDGNVNREDASLQVAAIDVPKIGKLEPLSLFRADLRGKSLNGRNLRCVSFIGADLTEASLFGADLRGAFFNRAAMVHTNLERTDLRGAIFHHADVTRLIYQPAQAPKPPSLALSKNLNAVTYDDDPTALYAAKTALKERGYLDAHKDVIAALRRSQPPEDSLAPGIRIARAAAARSVQTVLFDWTCEFGSNAFRPLVVIACLWLMCGITYGLAIMKGGRGGLFLVATGERIPKGKKSPHVMRLHCGQATRLRRLKSSMSVGLFFSFRRTFHFGFKELDFGNWLKLLQSREFDIRAYGWPRVLSGAQSITSIYLLALSILSAFSTPFDL